MSSSFAISTSSSEQFQQGVPCSWTLHNSWRTSNSDMLSRLFCPRASNSKILPLLPAENLLAADIRLLSGMSSCWSCLTLPKLSDPKSLSKLHVDRQLCAKRGHNHWGDLQANLYGCASLLDRLLFVWQFDINFIRTIEVFPWLSLCQSLRLLTLTLLSIT